MFEQCWFSGKRHFLAPTATYGHYWHRKIVETLSSRENSGCMALFLFSILSLLASCTLLAIFLLLLLQPFNLIKWHSALVLYLETELTKTLRFNCVFLVVLFWAYLTNFSSFYKFKAELACCQVSAIYLVNCHFLFMGLWCFITRDWSDQNASFYSILFPRLFSTIPPNFIRIRNVRAEPECRKVQMLVCNYFSYFYCAFSCNCVLLFLFAAAFVFPAAAVIAFFPTALSILCLSFTNSAQMLTAAIWLLIFNRNLLICDILV